jgi:hypothetical protein
MTPIQAFQEIQRLEREPDFANLRKIMEDDAIQTVKHGLKEAVFFDFGASVPEHEHIEFAYNLMQMGKFKLPFPVMWVQSQISKTSKFLFFSLDETLGVITCGPGISVDGSKFLNIMPLMLTFTKADGSETDIHYRSFVNKEGANFRTRAGVPYSDEDIKAMSSKSFKLMLGWTALLMSKDVATERTVAKPGVNARRQRQGRLPIADRYVVKIRPEARERQARAALGFERASPKMHWRRGHFRKVPNGEVIPIAPMIIGARGEVQVPEKKAYKV